MPLVPFDSNEDRMVPLKPDPKWVTKGNIPYLISGDRNRHLETDDIDLREVLAGILCSRGNYILLRRTERNIHCSCWNPLNQDADSTCVYCGGTGRVSIIEKHITRKTKAVLMTTLTHNVMLQDPHNFTITGFIFYFKYDVNPQIQDLLYEVGWNDDGTPDTILTEYRINYIEPLRDKRGRVEYWRVGADSKPVNRKIHSVQVRRLRDYIQSGDKDYYSLSQ